MQTTLSELLNEITPLPYQGFTRYILKDGRFLATAHAFGDDAPSSLGFAPGQEPHQSMEKAEANGTYLRHCANVLPELMGAMAAAIERMEAVAQGIPVHNRAVGVSQATHVAHMAGHLAQHAKIARAALSKAENITT